MPHPPIRSPRCAIYTRKSATDGRLQEGSSIELQHEVCSAYIKSQVHRSWQCVGQRYDDFGYSGGNTNRPALARLLQDIEDGLIDVVIIYKLDRLTRSLGDFIRLADLFEQFGVTFVSVTQAFDTQDSMGRLIQNVLLTFAQFEREMIADRIRDKMRSMKQAGRWTGGAPPYGYDVVDGKLVVNPRGAIVVRTIFERYLELRSSNQLTQELRGQGFQAKSWINRQGTRSGGGLATRGMIYAMLGSPVYVGEFHLRSEVFHGIHQPIIDRPLWDAVQALRDMRKLKRPPARPEQHLLQGIMFDGFGRRMKIEQGAKERTIYRYYISDWNHPETKRGIKQLRGRADEMEDLIKSAITSFFRRKFELGGAVYSLGTRDAATDMAISNGPRAARHLETFDRRRLRHAWEALIDKIEVSRDTVRILLRCDQIAAFLAWRGTGLFRDRLPDAARQRRIHVLEVDAIAVRSERTFKLPIVPHKSGASRPNKGLVALMRFAWKVQNDVYENRSLSMQEIAQRFRRKPAYIARVLRLNYLAPDIIAAVMDGTQPPGLTREKLIFSSLPMDWPQQRTLLGFPAKQDPSGKEVHY